MALIYLNFWKKHSDLSWKQVESYMHLNLTNERGEGKSEQHFQELIFHLCQELALGFPEHCWAVLLSGRRTLRQCSCNSDPHRWDCQDRSSTWSSSNLLPLKGVKMHECAEGYQSTALPQAVAIFGAVLDLAGKAVYTADYWLIAMVKSVKQNNFSPTHPNAPKPF